MKIELTVAQIGIVIEACQEQAGELRSDHAINGFVGEVIQAEKLEEIIDILTTIPRTWPTPGRASNR